LPHGASLNSVHQILGRIALAGEAHSSRTIYGPERHRAKTLSGLLIRLVAKVAAYTCGQVLNNRLVFFLAVLAR
jgi:hypothetical protein